VGAINRVGVEAPWKIGEFYGQSYFCDPRGQILAEAPRDEGPRAVGKQKARIRRHRPISSATPARIAMQTAGC
jgi:predicted amidohydrolase